MQKDITIIESPSNLGLKPPAPGLEPGVIDLPEALLAAGLELRLGARRGARIAPPPYSPVRDPKTGLRNAQAIRRYSLNLGRALESALDLDRFPLVLGGDCSILLGSLLALRRRGRFGLLFLDGHTDFGTPQTSQTGGAAGMDLALACGYGPEVLSNIANARPLIRETDVVIFGNRDVTDPANYIWQEVFDTEISIFDLAAVRAMGLEQAAKAALAILAAGAVDGFWIHLDADVLDDAVMPAVDSRQPGGLSYAELVRLLRILLSSSRVAGMEITIYDPTLDPGGGIARDFVGAIVAGFQQEGAINSG